MKILLGLTGSVATTIVQKLYDQLSMIGEVKIVKTDKSFKFNSNVLSNNRGLFSNLLPYTDEHEWVTYSMEKTVLHVDLRKWADVFVIAPLSANTLGKISNGICDNLLTCIAQAWDFTKPVIVAPAMNTHMFTNPTTQKNLKVLSDMGYIIVPPMKKVLACGDDGIGAMAQIQDIVDTISRRTNPWLFPLKSEICPGIPVNKHPGSFSCLRKHDVHTGVDLYCNDGEIIYSCTDGVVVEIKPFTGPSIGHTWWNETNAIVVDTGTNYILYGECESTGISEGSIVKRGQVIGSVKQVLPSHKLRKDIPGHSCSMLHLELLRRNPIFTEFQGRNGFMTWDLGKPQPYDLFDPTQQLIKSENAPGKLLDYLK